MNDGDIDGIISCGVLRHHDTTESGTLLGQSAWLSAAVVYVCRGNWRTVRRGRRDIAS